MSRTISGRILPGILAFFLLVYGLLSAAALWPAKTVPVEQVAGKHALFVTVSGRAIHFEKAGKGRPLILIHGFAGSTHTWRSLMPLLSGRFTLYALDLPGFGLSDKPSEYNYDMQNQARLVLGFMDALGLRSAALAGHSMGGIIAASTALQAPERVESLVLIEPGFYSSATPAFLGSLFFPFDRIAARLFYSKAFRRKFFSSSFYDQRLVTDAVLDAYMVPTKTPGAIDALVSMFPYAAARYAGITGGVSRPALVVWGENRRSTRLNAALQAADRVKREIAGSRLVLIPECGHYVQEEKPLELARAMDDFLK